MERNRKSTSRRKTRHEMDPIPAGYPKQMEIRFAEDHEMQQGANQALARTKKRINQNGDKEERRKRASPAWIDSHRTAAEGSAGLDEQPSLERDSAKPCYLDLELHSPFWIFVRPYLTKSHRLW
jgi:hypothetical protein